MDTVTQIQSHLLAHQYGDLIKKAKLKGGCARRAREAAMNIILLGPPGRRQGHPGAAGWSSAAAWSSCRPATCCAPRSKAGTPIGLKAKAMMDAGELVSDEIVVGT